VADSFFFADYFKGFAISFGLIMATGAQNAFVIRQGLRREHRFTVALVSAVLDSLLISRQIC